MSDKPLRFFHDLARAADQRGKSDAWGDIVNRCAYGEEVVFFYCASRPFVAGHIHSPQAMAEYNRSGVCGFHSISENAP